MGIPELSDDVDASTVERLRESPPLWIRNFIRHPVDPSKPYNFKTTDGEPLTHLLDDDSWLHPENWADINVLLLARGELKSFSTGAMATWAHDAFPQLHTYYIAPDNGQVIDYLEPIRETYVEQADMDGRRQTNNKTSQVFKTYQKTGDEVNPVLGRFQTDSGYSEKSVRGKHSQLGITDETQDLKERVFNVFQPAIDKQLPEVDYFPTTFCIGTPKETGSFYHDLWERSDKRTWDAEEGEWIIQEEVEPYELTADDVADLPGNIDVEEAEEYTIHGWHVDWINSPLHDASDIARAKQQATGEMEFVNEVLAQFYEPEDNLLAESDVRGAFNPDYNFRESPYNDDSTVAVVADWGGGKDKNASDTIILTVEEVTYDDGTTEYVVLDIDFLDTSLRNREQIREYEKRLIQYDADVGLVDYGFGQQAMESLQHGDDTMDDDGYMDIVSAVHYGHVKDKSSIKWTTDDNDNKTFFTCDKARSATMMVEAFRDNKWIIPKDTRDGSGVSLETSDDEGVRLLEQLTAPYKTLSEGNTGNKRIYIETPGNQRDDSFDVFCFAALAFQEIEGDDETVIDFAGNTRPGVA